MKFKCCVTEERFDVSSTTKGHRDNRRNTLITCRVCNKPMELVKESRLGQILEDRSFGILAIRGMNAEQRQAFAKKSTNDPNHPVTKRENEYRRHLNSIT